MAKRRRWVTRTSTVSKEDPTAHLHGNDPCPECGLAIDLPSTACERCNHPLSTHFPGYFIDGGDVVLNCTECDEVCPVPLPLVKGQGSRNPLLSLRSS
jgi:hypothetical protein